MKHYSWLGLILILFLAFSFLSLPRNPLLTDDASAYALAVKHVVQDGQWLAQLMNPGDLSSFEDKPPLGIWLLAWVPKVFGLNQITLHLPNLFYYLLLLGALYWFVSRLGSKDLAFRALLIAATSLALVVYSRTPKLDVLLTLFTFIAQFSLFYYIKKQKVSFLYLFTLALACGFLTKSGFILMITALNLLVLFIFSAEARQRLLQALFSHHFIFNAGLFCLLVGGVLYSQSFTLKEQWIPYLKSITIQSKYNTSYLGFGFYPSIFGLLLITLFPWMPLFFKGLQFPIPSPSSLPAGRQGPFGEGRNSSAGRASSARVRADLTLPAFCRLWFWASFLFFLFFYRQTDFRTFVVLVPPMTILAAYGLAEYEDRGHRWIGTFSWNIFYLLIFSLILIAFTLNPHNQQGFSLAYALTPVFFFVLSLLCLTFYFWKPRPGKLIAAVLLICISYGILFWNTKPIANAFNEDLKWPAMIKDYQSQGYHFYIYRPPDRNLFYSPDLQWVDYTAGPADRYFWDGKELTKELKTNKAIVLSDTKSWEKLQISNGQLIAKDSYSSLIKTR